MPTPTAAEIIERVKARYAGCRTYQDEGEQTTRFVHREPDRSRSHTSKKRFRTAFVRPDLFFFEYREVGLGPESEWTHGIVCSTPTGTQKWWSLRSPDETPGDLSHALGGFAGVTGGTSIDVPSLLIPSPRAWRTLPDSNSAVLLGDEDLAGRRCHRVEGTTHPLTLPAVVWIEVDTGHVLRLDERGLFTEQSMAKMHEDSRKRLQAEVKDPAKLASILEMLDKANKERNCQAFTTETTTIWHPRMDHAIDAKVFEFVPPG